MHRSIFLTLRFNHYNCRVGLAYRSICNVTYFSIVSHAWKYSENVLFTDKSFDQKTHENLTQEFQISQVIWERLNVQDFHDMAGLKINLLYRKKTNLVWNWLVPQSVLAPQI